jgi:hypothetical protein
MRYGPDARRDSPRECDAADAGAPVRPGWLAGRRAMFGALLGPLLLVPAARAVAAPALTVWKDRSCGCCGGWVAHMRAAGIAASVVDTDDMDAIKLRLGVPDALQSCHTATLEGYVLEGHVPAQDVQRLLLQRPVARGLSAPGMPPSAPGMDAPGPHQPYAVILFGTATGDRLFAQH